MWATSGPNKANMVRPEYILTLVTYWLNHIDPYTDPFRLISKPIGPDLTQIHQLYLDDTLCDLNRSDLTHNIVMK